MYKKTAVLFLVCALTMCSNATLYAGHSCIPIVNLPMEINHAGHYCLMHNFYYSGTTHAITIKSSHVVLDLNRHKIQLTPWSSKNSIYGIYSKNAHDLIIKNGKVSGFMYGIYLADKKGSNTKGDSTSGNYLIENMQLTNNTFRAIRLEGVKHVVRNNLITHTGGSEVFANAFAIGIEIIGPQAQIERNSIRNTKAKGTGESIAISFSNNCQKSVARDNEIFNPYALFAKRAHHRGSSGHSFGIWVGGNLVYPSDVLLQNNRIKNYYYGIAYSSPTRGVVSGNAFYDVDRDLFFNGAVVIH
ncbi:hypothetical protein [Legionella worsleiensis]|uniref:Right handed beta helix domain-containing protein n=1 Tax=Legionella worsleiensis TaxID=45076 RepID=A0A0W1A3H3_9GAMM|nr:hypothetical protein [Legionella worsleiensis]KTD75860.1 hypothetical protein Lwor_2426 [Legionella worsleiensis]STY32873.1 nitrous oxide reductase family maturation protein NosD [Legionella worsleiensis]